ncbi:MULTISPECIES: tripartite tricarboxylate transporter substrate binding protein [unclassified Achromobacter]|uniref:Bug family tripartite tricarboxylate transporter substrate binding protein n=1 Tax=unclassified Achromobacter TaxID=2626865 RepID=UPI0013038661|nr:MULTISPECIES: tripartite tricarboxylate transporter substrate binding protein [unclassified Achromobacter]
MTDPLIRLRKSARRWTLQCGLALLLTGTAHAAYPEHPVTMVSAFPPGGSTDVIGRMLSPRLGEIFKQTFLVENRAGASGNIATDYVVRSAPNGETILVGNNTMTVNAALGVAQNFNLQKDLTPIIAIAETPVALAVSSKLPVNSVQELIAYGKAHPGTLSFSSCGTGTAQHFAGVEFAHRAGIDMVHVPYKGCAPALTDGLSGQVPVIFNAISNISPQLKTGKIKLLAVATRQRVPFHPDVPALAELPGFKDYDFAVWLGFFVTAKTPQPIVDRLRKEFMALAQDKATQQALSDRLFVPLTMDGPALQKQIGDELVKWKKLADEYHITLD